MTVLNENPASTRGRANSSIPYLSYPLNESLSSMTRLKFVKYSRFDPWNKGEEEETAVITLPLPVTVPENYSFNTSQTDLGVIGNINNSNWNKLTGGGSSDAGTMIKDALGAGQAAVTNIVKSKNFQTAAAVSGINLLTGGGIDQDAVSAFTGIVTNPHTTITFNGVNLRGINLEWRLSARSEDESRMIKNIFDRIKLQAHPPEVTSGFALNYPDLVYIEFDGKVKNYMPSFQRAFINNINITPDSSGGMPLFKSGAPVIYNFQLSATEISIVTRDRLQEQIAGETTGANR